MNFDAYFSTRSKKNLDSAITDNNIHALILALLKGTNQNNITTYIKKQLHLKDHDVKTITPEKTSIGIDKIRSIKLEMSLKNPSGKTLLIINNAELLTEEAQNALLKILEEPTPNLLIVLYTDSIDNLLPTVRSRCYSVEIGKPEAQVLKEYLMGEGFKEVDIDKALNVSNGLPDLTLAILNKESTNLTEALEYSKDLLKYPLYKKIKEVDTLSKNKEKLVDLLYALELIANAGSKSTIKKTASLDTRWQRILEAVLDAKTNLSHNVNTRLFLTKLMLEL